MRNKMSSAQNSIPLRIGIAGLGTVGTGTLALLEQHAPLLASRAGRSLVVNGVSARQRQRVRGVAIERYRWFDDPLAMANDPEIDVVVELIGGSEGVAKALVEKALSLGKPVVTANKALLALSGTALAELAERHETSLRCEAAVAGGIPIIKGLREGLAANRITAVYGILNGTSNFILSQMRQTRQSFAHVLEEAQRAGYAEADPSFDIDGIDAAHKLTLLASVAFGVPVDFHTVHVEGIRHIAPLDIDFAEELGYRIKLLAIARHGPHGIERRVHPSMIPHSATLANVEGVFNAVYVEGDFCDRMTFIGRGAGGGPTASAVVADLVDLARGYYCPLFGEPVAVLTSSSPVAGIERRFGEYYLRLMVSDRPGVIADIGAAMRDHDVSIEKLSQHGRGAGPYNAVPVVLTTHAQGEPAMRQALKAISALPAVLEPPCLIRIEAL
jgi:homoserine dehydrogenase